MIKIVKGDLLQAKENIIAHQVNCMGVMGSGVARQIREKYPNVFREYIELISNYPIDKNLRKNLLGKVQGVRVGHKKWIANMFGQYYYGRDKQYTDTEALFKCFQIVRGMAERAGVSVAMPYMVGCGLGGADWKEVENLLITAFDGYEVTLYKL